MCNLRYLNTFSFTSKQRLMEQVKKLSFAGEDIFCGIDVHRKSWKVSIRDKFTEFRILLSLLL